MQTFTFWYKKEVRAKDIFHACKAEGKVEPVFASVETHPEKDTRDREPLIGFHVGNDSDEE